MSPKANFDTEGTEEALKQEINHLLRKIDMLEKNSASHRNVSPADSQNIVKLVDRLEVAWDGVINRVEERQLLLKEAITSADDFFINLIMEFREALAGRGSEVLLRTKFLPILEEMEEFFGQNWNGVGPREVIDKLHCFHEIVKDEIKALKGVVQSKPQTAKDKLKRIKKRWKHSLERIDEIVSDEEEEKEIINGLLTCMEDEEFDENDRQENTIENFANDLNHDHFVERLDDERDSIVKHKFSESQNDFSKQLKIDLTKVNERGSSPTSAQNENFDRETLRNSSKTGRMSSSRLKDPKLVEIQELLREFTPQKIRMILKENNLLNKKIQKQRFLILEMRNKMDEVEENRRDKTHRLNRSCDDIPTSVLGNLEKVVDDSMAQWNEAEVKQAEAVLEDRKSSYNRRTTHKSRLPSVIPHVQAEDGEVVFDIDFRINSPRNMQTGEGLREIGSSNNLGDNDEMFQPTPQKYGNKIDQSQKADLVKNLFDPRKRFQPNSREGWRDTVLDRETVGSLNGVETINPMLSTAMDGPAFFEYTAEDFEKSPEKDPFHSDNKTLYRSELEEKNSKKSPEVQSPEKSRLKSELASLSKKFRELEGQKKVWENKALALEAQKENKMNFSKSKTGDVITEHSTEGKLHGELLSPLNTKYSPKPAIQPPKISLFSNLHSNRDNKGQSELSKLNREEDDRSEMQVKSAVKDGLSTGFSFAKVKRTNSNISAGYCSPTLSQKSPEKYQVGTAEALRMAAESPPRILTEFLPEDSMRRSNNDDEVRVLDHLLQEKTKEAINYLKQIEKLQKENDQLRENPEGSSSLSLYKLKIENRKLKDAIKKIAGKVKQEIGSPELG